MADPTIAQQAYRSIIDKSAATAIKQAARKANVDHSNVNEANLAKAKVSTIVTNKKNEVIQKHQDMDRAPRQLYSNMDTIRGVGKGTTTRYLINRQDERQTILQSLKSMNVASIYETALNEYTVERLINDLQVETVDVEHRVASVPLNKVLKGSTEHKQAIIKHLDSIAFKTTQLYRCLALCVYESMIIWATSCFDGSHTVTFNDLTNAIKVTTLRSNELSNEQAKLFSVEHIQYLQSNVLGSGSRKTTHAKYPLWKKILDLTTKQEAHNLKTATVREVVTTITQNIDHMYDKGKITRSCLDPLLKVLVERYTYATQVSSDDDQMSALSRIAMTLSLEEQEIIDSTVLPLQEHEQTPVLPLTQEELDMDIVLPLQEHEQTPVLPLSQEELEIVSSTDHDTQGVHMNPKTRRSILRQSIKATTKQLEKLRRDKHPDDKKERRKSVTEARLTKLKAELKLIGDKAKKQRSHIDKNDSLGADDIDNGDILDAGDPDQDVGAYALGAGGISDAGDPDQDVDDFGEEDNGRAIEADVHSEDKSRSNVRRTTSSICGFLKKILLQEDTIERSDLKELWEGNLSVQVEQVIWKLYTQLRPLLHSIIETKFSIISQIPFCFLANSILVATGNESKTRSMFPMPSTGSVHSLVLTPSIVYEIFKDHQHIISNVNNKGVIKSVKTASEHPKETLSWVFDMDVIDKICAARRYISIDRFIVTSSHITRIVCQVEDPSKLAPQYDPPAYFPPVIDAPKVELIKDTNDTEEKINKLETHIKTLMKELDDTNKGIAALNSTPSPAFAEQVRTLKGKKKKLHHDILQQQEELRVNKKALSTLKRSMKAKHTKKQSNREKITLDEDTRTCLAPAWNIDVSSYRHEDEELACVGTDYGFHTLATSIPMTESSIKGHIKLLCGQDNNEEFNPLPKASNLYSKDIAFKTGELKRRSQLETIKKKTDDGKAVTEIEKQLRCHSYRMALNVKQLHNVHEVHSSHIKEMTSFYQSSTMQRKRRQQEIQRNTWKQRVLAQQRKDLYFRLSHMAASGLTTLPIMMIGHAGMGFGSKIKGFFRFGGKWMRADHARFWPVAIVNEYRTSQICAFCGMQVTRPFTADGKKARGACLCTNPFCVSVKHGRSTSGRDQMAAANICIKGYALVHSIELTQLNPHPSVKSLTQ